MFSYEFTSPRFKIGFVRYDLNITDGEATHLFELFCKVGFVDLTFK